MAARVPLPAPPLRLAVGLRALAANTALRDDLQATVANVANCGADIWLLAVTSVLDRHGYQLEIYRD